MVNVSDGLEPQKTHRLIEIVFIEVRRYLQDF